LSFVQINFFVFLIITPRFHNQVKRLFRKKRFRSVQMAFKQINPGSINNQINPESGHEPNDNCRVSIVTISE